MYNHTTYTIYFKSRYSFALSKFVTKQCTANYLRISVGYSCFTWSFLCWNVTTNSNSACCKLTLDLTSDHSFRCATAYRSIYEYNGKIPPPPHTHTDPPPPTRNKHLTLLCMRRGLHYSVARKM